MIEGIKTVCMLPEKLNDSKAGKLPVVGAVVSVGAAILTSIRLVAAVVVAIFAMAVLPFANLIKNEASKEFAETLPVAAAGIVGISFTTLLHNIFNVASLGFANWKSSYADGEHTQDLLEDLFNNLETVDGSDDGESVDGNASGDESEELPETDYSNTPLYEDES